MEISNIFSFSEFFKIKYLPEQKECIHWEKSVWNDQKRHALKKRGDQIGIVGKSNYDYVAMAQNHPGYTHFFSFNLISIIKNRIREKEFKKNTNWQEPNGVQTL